MSLPAYALNQASFPEMYERYLVGWLFRPWAEVLIDRTAPAPGERVLDVACGTGIVARVARERIGADGQVVGVDLSPQMLATARSVAPEIDWREGSAQALPLAGGEQFDVVVCHQGLQFFPDKPAAAREFRRALKPGGRLGIGTWRSDDEIPFFRELRTIAERHLGPVDDARYGFGDPTALEGLLEEAGFRDVRVEAMSATTGGDDGALFARLNAMALVGMSAPGKTMDEETRMRTVAAIVEDSMPVVSRYSGERDGPGVRFEIRTNIATARG